MTSQSLILIAAALNIASVFSYVRALLRGRARPNRVSWFLWALPPLVASAAQWSSGAGLSTLIVFISGLGPLLIFLVSFLRPAEAWQVKKIDYACGAVSLLGMGLWGLTSNPLHAVVFSIASDALAGIPTVLKSYAHPESEDGNAFALACMACLLGLLAIPQHTFMNSAFLVYLFTTTATVSTLIYRRPLIKALRCSCRCP